MNILKQFAMLGTYSKNDPFKIARLKLTMYYVCFVAGVLAVFTFGLYMLFVEDVIDNIVGYDSFFGVEDDEEGEEDENEAEEKRKITSVNDEAARFYFFNQLHDRLVGVIIFLDGSILFISIFVSYYVAGKTLQPIKEMHDLQKKFTADAAHEFRTPLTVLKTGAESTLATSDDIAQYKKLAHDFVTEVDHLTSLINDLLFLAKWNKAVKNSFEDFDISALVMERVDLLRSYAEEHDVHFTKISVKENIFLYGSRANIARLLLNIIKNAIDYNKKGGSVDIFLTKQRSRIILTIIDTGIGLSQEEKHHVFDRFYKVDKARTSGFGLGMSIVKDIVDQHDGEILIESMLSRGTKIKITFPLKN